MSNTTFKTIQLGEINVLSSNPSKEAKIEAPKEDELCNTLYKIGGMIAAVAVGAFVFKHFLQNSRK